MRKLMIVPAIIVELLFLVIAWAVALVNKGAARWLVKKVHPVMPDAQWFRGCGWHEKNPKLIKRSSIENYIDPGSEVWSGFRRGNAVSKSYPHLISFDNEEGHVQKGEIEIKDFSITGKTVKAVEEEFAGGIHHLGRLVAADVLRKRVDFAFLIERRFVEIKELGNGAFELTWRGAVAGVKSDRPVTSE